jgi:FkbM family methyltransferase
MPRPKLLSNGLSVYGASHSGGRQEEFIVGEYFDSDFALGPGATVFDIGANIGLFSLELLRRHDGKVRIVACEPAPEPFGFLARNVRELFPSAHVTCRCCAVSDRVGSTTLYFRPRLSVISSLHREPLIENEELIDQMLKQQPGNSSGNVSQVKVSRRVARELVRWLMRLVGWWMTRKVVEVPCTMTTVSQLISETAVPRIDLLKIDVEGAELDVLRGINADDWPKIRAIVAEVHDFDGRVETMRGMLESASYDRIHFGQEPLFEGTNIYMLHASRDAAGGASAGAGSEATAAPPASR